MTEREPKKEAISQGELFYLWHSETEEALSGYGLTARSGTKEFLVGVLVVDQPKPAEPSWLKEVEDTFGEYKLAQMTATGERGIVCQMQIEPQSQPYLRRFHGDIYNELQEALQPLLEEPPAPVFSLRWDDVAKLWRSDFAPLAELPVEIREVFEQTGYGCLAAEANVGVVHICHASNADIASFRGQPTVERWQIIKMPTAPLIRVTFTVFDNPVNPYKFESFLNVDDEDQARILDQLANQDHLYLAFYGDDLTYRFTKLMEHGEQQWQQLDELVEEAITYWKQMPLEQRDFDLAKAEFMKQFI